MSLVTRCQKLQNTAKLTYQQVDDDCLGTNESNCCPYVQLLLRCTTTPCWEILVFSSSLFAQQKATDQSSFVGVSSFPSQQIPTDYAEVGPWSINYDTKNSCCRQARLPGAKSGCMIFMLPTKDAITADQGTLSPLQFAIYVYSIFCGWPAESQAKDSVTLGTSRPLGRLWMILLFFL